MRENPVKTTLGGKSPKTSKNRPKFEKSSPGAKKPPDQCPHRPHKAAATPVTLQRVYARKQRVQASSLGGVPTS